MKYLLGVLVSIALVVAVFILVLRGLNSSKPAEVSKVKLADYASSEAVVRFTTDGPVVADQDHRAYRITVGRTSVTMETLKGYQYSLIDNKTYANNQTSYDTFLRALENAGFAKGDPKASKDERGSCATGRRFIMELLNGATTSQRYWSTSCGSQGNFKGTTDAVRQLFVNQIPRADFNKLVNNLSI